MSVCLNIFWNIYDNSTPKQYTYKYIAFIFHSISCYFTEVLMPIDYLDFPTDNKTQFSAVEILSY